MKKIINNFLLLAMLVCLASVIFISQTKNVYGQNSTTQDSEAEKEFILGNNAVIAKDYEKAIQHYTQAIKLNPSYERAYKERAGSYEKLKKYDLAINDFTNIIDMNPQYVEYYFAKRAEIYQILGKTELADEDKIKSKKAATVDALYKQGLKLIGEKKYELAIENFSKAIELAPTDWGIYSSRGKAYKLNEQYELAIKDLNIALKADYFLTDVYYRGMAYFELKQYEAAIKDFTDSMSWFQKENLHLRGKSYYYLGKYDLALQDLTKLIELAPDNANAYQTRSLVYSKLGKTELSNADLLTYTRLITPGSPK